MSPGVIAEFLLSRARIVIDRRDENLVPVRIAGERFRVPVLHQHSLESWARSIESVRERWLRWRAYQGSPHQGNLDSVFDHAVIIP